MAFFSGSRGGDAFAAECLKAMNDYRSRHQVPALRLNAQISKISQSWADQIARSNNFSHNRSAVYNNVDLGENIAMKWNSNKTQFSGQEIVEMWYNEIKDYSFRTHSGPKTGHFTQLVWKASTEVGIGKAVAPDGKFFVVANFNPPGNFVGRFGENVLPPKDGKVVLESGSNPQPSRAAMPPRSSPAVEDHSSLYSRATPAHFGRDPFGLSAAGSSGGGGSSSSVTRRQVVQETTGRGSNAVTKTVVIETVRNPDGSTRTVQTESCSSRDQPTSASGGFEEIEKKFGMFRINRNEGTAQNSAQGSPSTVTTTKKYTVSSNVTPAAVSNSPWSTGAAEARVAGPSPFASSSTSTSTGTQSMKEFTDDIIKSHNKYRRKHGQVGDVRLNKDLSEIAQRWADRLAASRSMQHSQNKFQGLPLGENLASKYGSGKLDYKGDEVVADWYSEIKDYDFRNSDRSVSMSTGHFTQVVWKGSREIGVGRASSRDGSCIFVVCNYFPAGNVIGKFRENVLPG